MSVLEDWTEKAIPVDFVSKESWPEIAERLPPEVAAYAKASGFEAKAGAVLLAPSSNGGVARVLFGVEGPSARRRHDPFAAGKLATLLPSGLYRLGDAVEDPSLAALAFLLSSYSFSRYRKPKSESRAFARREEFDRARIERVATAVSLGRDLVNTPANEHGSRSACGSGA